MTSARARANATGARLAAAAWPVAQQTGAATAAWVIAEHVVDHRQPFFAPIAAVVALNASRGERGTNALRLLLGVVLGIAVAEPTVAVLGGGWVALAVATLVATLLAVVLGGQRLVIAQAAAAAILTVAASDGQVGYQRVVDALIGAGVALVISQIVFPAEPIRLLRHDESAALRDMAAGLDAVADALRAHDDVLADRSIDRLRDVRSSLVALGHTRDNTRLARRSTVRWGSTTPAVHESENAGELDLLGSSCVTLGRMALMTDDDERIRLAPVVHELAGSLSALATDLGDRAGRQQVADRALAVARSLGVHPRVADAGEWAAAVVATDIMTFAGVDPDEAAAAVRDDTGELRVACPPRTRLTRCRRRGPRSRRSRRQGDAS